MSLINGWKCLSLSALSLSRPSLLAYQCSFPIRYALRIDVEIIDHYVGVKAKFFEKWSTYCCFLNRLFISEMWIEIRLTGWLIVFQNSFEMSLWAHFLLLFDRVIAIDNTRYDFLSLRRWHSVRVRSTFDGGKGSMQLEATWKFYDLTCVIEPKPAYVCVTNKSKYFEWFTNDWFITVVAIIRTIKIIMG